MAENNLFDQNIQPVQQGVSDLLSQDYNSSVPQGDPLRGSSQALGGQYSSSFGQDAYTLRQSLQPVYSQQPGYTDPGYSQVPPMPEYNFAMESEVSVGEWLLSTILAFMPFVGFILLLVWGFGSETAKAKQNWAKAMLILKLAGIIIATISIASLGILFVRIFNNLPGNFW